MDLDRDFYYFKTLWEEKGTDKPRTSREWDRIAREWREEEKNGPSISNQERIQNVIDFLIERKALTPETRMIDVGSGPLDYAVAFGKIAREVWATDISIEMLLFGMEKVRASRLRNIQVTNGDFKTIDLDENGWRKAFDLVFTSTTPAIGSFDALRKLNVISRGFCFNQSVIGSFTELETVFLEDHLGVKKNSQKESRRYYALINLLILMGYNPELTYRKENRRRIMGEKEAYAYFERRLGEKLNEKTRPLFQTLFNERLKEGKMEWIEENILAYILWDTRLRVYRREELLD